MYNFEVKEANELVKISKNLGTILNCLLEIKDKEALGILEKTHQVHEWCEKARLHKGFSVEEMREMYAQVDEKYQEFFGKGRKDYLDEKDLAIVFIGLNEIKKGFKNLEKGLINVYNILGETYSAREILEKSRSSKLQAISSIREMYDKLGKEYKSVFEKDLGDVLKDKR